MMGAQVLFYGSVSADFETAIVYCYLFSISINTHYRTGVNNFYFAADMGVRGTVIMFAVG